MSNIPSLVIKPILPYNITTLYKYLKIRYDVFKVPENRPFFIEYDLRDIRSKHYALIVDGEIIGSVRICYYGKDAHLSRFAILPKYQGLGYGKRFLLQIFKMLEKRNIMLITIIVHKHMIEFYKKYNFQLAGYVEICGNLYDQMQLILGTNSDN